MPKSTFNLLQFSWDLAGGGTDGFLYENECVRRAVNVNWYDGGWNVNANPVPNPYDWNRGNHVVSRNYSVSPACIRWEFC